MVLQDGVVQAFASHHELTATSDFYNEALRLSVLQTSPAGA